MSLKSTANFTVVVSLVNIPMKMYKAIGDKDKKSDMHLLCPTDKVRIGQKNVCPKCDKTIEYPELIKGVEVEPDKWMIFSPEELKALGMARTERLEVTKFVPVEVIDSVYLEDDIYFLGPGLGFEFTFATLRDGLFASGKYAIGDFVRNGHDHRVVLRARERAIELRFLRPHAEVRSAADIPSYDTIPATGNKAHAKMMMQVIDVMSEDVFDVTAIVDQYAINKQRLIMAKIIGGDVEFMPDTPKKAATSDLEAALKASLDVVAKKAAPKKRKTA